MSNARDKANIPALNFSSTGIDDNATSTAITIDSSQQVGIGTASPTSKLQVEGSTTINSTGTPPLTIHHTDGTIVALAFQNDASDNHSLMFTDGDFRINYDGSEKMRINSSGNVGIGTSSPKEKLDSRGSAVFSGDHATGTNAFGTSHGVLISSTPNLGRITAVSNGANDVKLELRGLNGGSANSNQLVLDGNTSNVGIGTSSPQAQLHIYNSSGTSGFRVTRGNNITGVNMHMQTDSTSNYLNAYGNLIFGCSATGTGTGASERMRIDSSGSVLIGGTDTDPAINGTESIALRSFGRLSLNVDGSVAARIGRTSTDGSIVAFYQDGTQEGDIQINGTTTSYNGFTGTHWSRFTDNSTPTILRGTVLETLDEMCDWYNLEFDVTTQDDDGNDVISTKKIPHVLTDTQSVGDVITYNHEGTDYQATIVKEGDVKHMMSKVSDTTDAKNVYGVFVAYDNDGEGYNDFYVASVGSFVVRIKANETIAKGDLLQSNGDGTAKVQSDDNVKSSSFAKVLSTTVIETYEDGSFIVPCSLMC